MGKLFVESGIHTPAEGVRETLDEAERLTPRLRGRGRQALELLHLLDQAAAALKELEQTGMDVRAERARFESVQERLRSHQVRLLREIGTALQEERATVQPDRARWWWYIDESVARQRKRQLRRMLTGFGIAVLVLVVVWAIYYKFVASTPEGRAQALIGEGENLVQEGDLRGALAKFEAATALTPDDSVPLIWAGMLYTRLDEPSHAQAAFEAARSLYATDFDFLVERSMTYLRVGDLDAASADIEQAIRQKPDAGLGYYVRANIAAQKGDCTTAIADLQHASELAQATGEVQLEAAIRVQLAFTTQSCAVQQPTLSAPPAP
jgi:tetratricopeptide (TPR) repeat protein